MKFAIELCHGFVLGEIKTKVHDWFWANLENMMDSAEYRNDTLKDECQKLQKVLLYNGFCMYYLSYFFLCFLFIL